MKRLLVGIPLSLTFLGLHHQAFGQPATSEHGEYFEKHIRPIFVERCQGCHDSKAHTAGLDLTTASGLQKGADSGPVVVPGDLEKSRLIQVVSYLERTKMPPTGKLSDPELTALREWVKLGAPWPATATETPIPSGAEEEGLHPGTDRVLVLPASSANHSTARYITNRGFARPSIDSSSPGSNQPGYVLPRPPTSGCCFAGRRSISPACRRRSEDVEAFLADDSPDAFAKVVDRLLASPRYGERWGRHWLDVARYADSTGADEDYRYPHAWRYRDYVINAFNSDMPFDQFIREQIAGDLLPPPPGRGVNTRASSRQAFWRWVRSS